jgi:hypothetical protein
MSWSKSARRCGGGARITIEDERSDPLASWFWREAQGRVKRLTIRPIFCIPFLLPRLPFALLEEQFFNSRIAGKTS